MLKTQSRRVVQGKEILMLKEKTEAAQRALCLPLERRGRERCVVLCPDRLDAD